MKAERSPQREFGSPEEVMQRAVELARRGIGWVEPNPAVGAVVVDRHLRLLGEGFHRKFGEAHAEVEALRACPSPLPPDAVLFVTLEPCCHYGKTPPCTEAILQAGIRHVVVGMIDPSPHAAGQGIERLRAAGVQVEVGLLEQEVRKLNAPFVKRVTTGLPYVHVKWAMTLDGKTATRTGSSQWISNEASRRLVHQLRGRMDAVCVGIRTVLADDPLLTARPPGPRLAVRVVFDSQALLPLHSRLVQTAREVPVLLVTTAAASQQKLDQLQQAGVEVLVTGKKPCQTRTGGETEEKRVCLKEALEKLAARSMTNVLFEGGGTLVGGLFDERLVDEVHAFVAPKFFGGRHAPTPVCGEGVSVVTEAALLEDVEISVLETDVYIHGRLHWPDGTTNRTG